MLLAQITDLHIKAEGRPAYGRVDTAGALETTVAHINAMADRPDAVLVTGDLVDSGGLAEYRTLRPLLERLAVPSFVVPGNHDRIGPFREAFADCAYIDPSLDHVSYAVEDFPLRLIGLDTSVAGAPHGELPPERLAWLDDALGQAPAQPTLIFLHHPPFAMGVRHMDVQILLNADDLFAVLRRHRQVLHVAAGHVHRAAETTIDGIACSSAPAPAHAVTLAFAPDAPPSFTLEPPQVRLFRFADGRLVSHLSPVGSFDGPHPFFQPDGALIV